MRTLPIGIDADLVLALGQMLDDHAKMASVSIADLVNRTRAETTTALGDLEIEELIIEMAASRGLAVLLDRRSV